MNEEEKLWLKACLVGFILGIIVCKVHIRFV